MSNCVKIEQIWNDDDIIELFLKISGRSALASFNIYISPNELSDLAIVFANFSEKSGPIKWACGDSQERKEIYLILELNLYDKRGWVRLSVHAGNIGNEITGFESKFSIDTEIGAVNRFGFDLQKMVRGEEVEVEGIPHRL